MGDILFKIKFYSIKMYSIEVKELFVKLSQQKIQEQLEKLLRFLFLQRRFCSSKMCGQDDILGRTRKNLP